MNISWAKEIIRQLILQGVDYFCLAPGSRVTPLAIAIAEDPEARTFIHYDERGSAFHALGAAKASAKPVAILTTSGTALGNIMPAVMEASLSRIPLILLTADRPPELRDTHANQTLDQVKLFTSFVRWEVDLPCPDASLPSRFLATTLAQAVFRAQNNPAGPVHINCMLREPFFTSELPYMAHLPCIYESVVANLSQNAAAAWAERLQEIEKGVIVVGSLAPSPSLNAIIELAEKLDWPILADIDSGLRSCGRAEPLIPYYDLILKTVTNLQPESILHFGDRLVSKRLLEWISDANTDRYYQIAEHPERADPKHRVSHRVVCSPCSFARDVASLIPEQTSWLDLWKMHSARVEENLSFPMDEISEPGIVRFLLKNISTEYAFFFANGMPVRDADSFFYPREAVGPIFTQRGVSGIDGNIATVAGISEGAKRPLIAVIGDQTALHDINSLAQLNKTAYPVILFIINNYGSGIFSFLPVHQNTSTALFEEYFAASHELSFEHAAALFNLPYYHPVSWEELTEVPLTQSCVVELTTDRARNLALHQEILEALNHYV